MERARGGWLVAVLASLLVCSLVAPAALGATERDGAAATDPPLVVQEFEADRTEFRITVYDNGSARWLFRYEQALENDAERQDFEAFAERFNTEETDLYTNFRNRSASLADSGTETTGREMRAEGFSRDARVEELGPAGDEFGVVEMSFDWVGFAALDGDRVVVGDTFEGGLYVGSDQRVVFERGSGLAFQTVQPEEDAILSGATPADSETVTWEGERSFTDNRPRLVLVPADEAVSETRTGTPTGTPATSDPGSLLPIGVFLVVLLVGLAAAVAYRAGSLGSNDGPPPAFGTGGDDPGDGREAREAPTDAADPAAGISEADLVSDEERVVSLLEEHGGRMKQVNIVEQTGWSKSKVSMLLSDMEDDDTISKLRVGRENIVSLAGHEPDAAGSPFDEEE